MRLATDNENKDYMPALLWNNDIATLATVTIGRIHTTSQEDISEAYIMQQVAWRFSSSARNDKISRIALVAKWHF